MDTRYIVMSAAAAMPSSCWGRYRRVAVVEVKVVEGIPANPKMISARARGVVRIVQTWEKLHVGRARSGRCAYSRAMAEAEGMANALNRQQTVSAPAHLVGRLADA